MERWFVLGGTNHLFVYINFLKRFLKTKNDKITINKTLEFL